MEPESNACNSGALEGVGLLLMGLFLVSLVVPFIF
jgi:hypothetical protein